MRGRRRRVGAQRRSRIPPSTPTAPIAKHRRRDAQFPCDLRQRPTAARQQGYCLPLELIGKLTTSLAHSTPSRSSSELSKGVHQFAGGSECPGYCGAQDTFYVGTLKGVGRIYQQTVIDTYAKVAFAKLYDRKTPITAAEILNDRVVVNAGENMHRRAE